VLSTSWPAHLHNPNAAHVVNILSRFTRTAAPTAPSVVTKVGDSLPPDTHQTPDDSQHALLLDLGQTRGRAVYFRSRRAIEYGPHYEDAVVSKVGRDLYENFFAAITRHQWQRDRPSLHASVCARTNPHDTPPTAYFTTWPPGHATDCYTAMFERILTIPVIESRFFLKKKKKDLIRRTVRRPWRTASHVYSRPSRRNFFDYEYVRPSPIAASLGATNEPSAALRAHPAGRPRQLPSGRRSVVRGFTEFRHLTGQAARLLDAAWSFPPARRSVLPHPPTTTRARSYKTLRGALRCSLPT